MSLATRGISHDPTGLPEDVVARELAVFRDELRCNAVIVTGTDADAQQAAARQALELGLEVWIQARADERPRDATLAHLADVAERAEVLRAARPWRVTLAVGNELSLLSRGIVPGPAVAIRLQLILRARRLLARRIARRLDAVLAEAAAIARTRFGGPVTYCAAMWERVDWCAST